MDHAVVDELKQLGMNKTVFETRIVSSSLEEDKNACTEKGIDKVEFLLSVNPGQELRSLSKVASGGELSRIMLALKNARSVIRLSMVFGKALSILSPTAKFTRIKKPKKS